MYCSKCGTENLDSADVRYCRSCGAELALGGTPSTAGGPGYGYGAGYSAFPGGVGVMQAAVFPYGGFWIRVVAYLIDAIILGIVGTIVGGILGAGVGASTALSGDVDATIAAASAAGGFASLLVGLAYYIVLPPMIGGTPGKVILGYHIVGEDGHHIGYGQAFVRYIGYIVSAIVLLLGFFWIAFDGKKQGWHDKIAGTYVVRSEFVK